MHFDMFHLIIIAAFYIAVPIMYFMLRNEAKAKRNIVLGVTLPQEARSGERVERIVKKFKRESAAVFVLLTAAALLAFFIRWDSIVLLYMTIWFPLAMVLPYIPYVTANRALKEIKKDHRTENRLEGITAVEIKTAAERQPELDKWMFAVPAFISFIPVFLEVYSVAAEGNDPFMLISYLLIALMAAACLPLYLVIFRQKGDAVTDDEELTKALTAVRRYQWGRNWAWLVWLTAALNIAWYVFKDGFLFMIFSFVYAAGVVFVCLKAEFDTRKAQEKLTANITGTGEYVDEDRYWPWGIIYYNKNDSHFIVNSRIGVGTTINMATAAGKAVAAVCVLTILALPLLGVYAVREEFTPVSVSVEDGKLRAYHTSLEYEVEVSDVERAYVTDRLDIRSRVNGTGMETVCKGKFKVNGIDGTCLMCIDPREKEFLVVTVKNGQTYVFDCSDEITAQLESYGLQVGNDAD